MGFFDRFKSKFARIGEVSKPKQAKQKIAREMATEVGREPPTVPVTGELTAYRTLVKPLVTEKTATLVAARKYVFVVRPEATRLSVKQAIRELYGVIPEAVHMANRAGKKVRFGKRSGQRKDWKKAIVTMPEGKTLPIYE